MKNNDIIKNKETQDINNKNPNMTWRLLAILIIIFPIIIFFIIIYINFINPSIKESINNSWQCDPEPCYNENNEYR